MRTAFWRFVFLRPRRVCTKGMSRMAIEVVKECSAQADGLSATYIGTKDEKIFIVHVSSLCSAKGKKGGGVWVYTEPPDILSSFAGMSGIG